MLRIFLLLFAALVMAPGIARAQLTAKTYPADGVQFTGADSCFSADSVKCKTAITFKCDVEWKVYDQYGNVVLNGFGVKVDISGLPKGGYYMVSEKRSFEFFKY